jgi:hypothetical protein
MIQVLISDVDDSNIVINLESNTILPGSYVNAEYNVPEDYKLRQLEQISNDIVKAEFVEQNINPKKYITNKKIISSYNDVIEHFKPSPEKYFITGITDSKSLLITKYFNKNDFFNSDEMLKDVENVDLVKFVGDENNGIIIEPNDFESNTIIRTNVKLDVPGLDLYAMILSENQSGLVEYVLYTETENPIKYIDLDGGLSRFMYMRSHDETQSSVNMVLYDGIIEEPKIISEVFIDRGLNSAFERIKKLKNIKDMNELNKVGLGYYKINTKGYNFKTR